jgi:succinoglycan biosynthesis protein ExoM
MRDHISICVCTFKRNQMLGHLLRTLEYQETGGYFDYSAVVVDNDKNGTAKATVDRLTSELSLRIDYDIEPEQTIPAARNRALRLARGNYIAIIDDDEFAPRNWLLTLYKAISEFSVDGGLGPVFPFFQSRPPGWLIRGRFCERPVIRTGTILSWTQTRTGNVLLKRDVFDKHHLQFDLKWKTSGSDRALFKEAIEKGFHFISVKEAPVYETVPSARWKRSYYLKRALVQGYNTYRYQDSPCSGLSHIGKSLQLAAASGVYILALPFAAFLGSHMMVKCLERGGHHFSRLLAMIGIEIIKKRDF